MELLVVPNCANEEPVAEQLRQALDDIGLHDTAWDTRVIVEQAEAEQAGFTGSPTIHIDGQDPFAEPGCSPGLACRVYRTPHGLAGSRISANSDRRWRQHPSTDRHGDRTRC